MLLTTACSTITTDSKTPPSLGLTNSRPCCELHYARDAVRDISPCDHDLCGWCSLLHLLGRNPPQNDPDTPRGTSSSRVVTPVNTPFAFRFPFFILYSITSFPFFSYMVVYVTIETTNQRGLHVAKRLASKLPSSWHCVAWLCVSCKLDGSIHRAESRYRSRDRSICLIFCPTASDREAVEVNAQLLLH